MYKRVIYENWTYIVPIVAFGFTLTFYSVMVIRAALLKPSKSKELAALPLDD
tara:strand:+ start:2065 stop:2220 length:156 start_codon:yes stop_codon:yes gene_type:complete